MASKRKKRRSFGASNWQMTERLFARGGKAPRRRTMCVREAKVIKAVVGRLTRSMHGIGNEVHSVSDAYDAASTGRCRIARKKIVKVIRRHPRLFSSRGGWFRSLNFTYPDLP